MGVMDVTKFGDETSFKNDVFKPLSVIEYLEQKEGKVEFDGNEELIFYPELYGIYLRSCPSVNFLKIYKDEKLRNKVERYINRTTLPHKRVPIMKYIYVYNFVEIYLNNLHLHNVIPEEVFLCVNLRILSLKGNFLKIISPNIGRLQKLEILELTDNSLKTNSLPYTLVFCTRLHTLYVDNNKMFALPGFILQMKSLQNIRRLSTKYTLRDYFEISIHKSTNRIEKINPTKTVYSVKQPETLLKLAIRCVVTCKINYLVPNQLPTLLQDVISHYYPTYIICENCIIQKHHNYEDGFFVYSFRQEYLGNSWSAFSFSACSEKCAKRIDNIESKYTNCKSINVCDKSAFVENVTKHCCTLC